MVLEDFENKLVCFIEFIPYFHEGFEVTYKIRIGNLKIKATKIIRKWGKWLIPVNLEQY